MNAPVSLNGDIPVGNWIDRWIPAPARPYLRLMRLDRPIGTWLLLFPCWWSSALAAEGWPDIRLFILFAVGAVVMRGAGCTVNDIADHKFDALVARTQGRPIPSGAVSVPQALAFLALQLLVGLAILLQLPPFAVMVGAASLLLVFPYPLMKRITWWPQAWLGLTFNWGALLGWAAVTGEIGLPALVLYAAGILWTLGYDTIYAHQDKEDDIMVGIKSTALRLGDSTPAWLVGFYGGTLALVGVAGWLAGLSWAFWPGLALAGLQLAWQVRTVDIDDGADCLDKFKSNRFFGWALLAAIIGGKLI
ncbi:MAG: 4-hydroxybenzoate octaprenyltransferase [Alphaproteobacteria bacterium]|nr:4-hydroxybenzoate octaprenyltransferase [Alphaproteobacteria bacterium]